MRGERRSLKQKFTTTPLPTTVQNLTIQSFQRHGQAPKIIDRPRDTDQALSGLATATYAHYQIRSLYTPHGDNAMQYADNGWFVVVMGYPKSSTI